MLEIALMRSFLKLYMTGKSRRIERQAFTMLASVCSHWRLTLAGWPGSPTGQWVRHQLRKLIDCEYFDFIVSRVACSCVDTKMHCDSKKNLLISYNLSKDYPFQ